MGVAVSDFVEPDGVAAALAGTRPFGDLDEELRRAVAEEGELVRAEAGETLVSEGDPSSGLYVLLDGAASVTVKVGDSHFEVGVVSPGDTFGELGVLLSEPRAATVAATEPSRLLYLSADALAGLVARDAAFGLALARDLAERLREALDEGNRLRAETGPGSTVLPAQDVSRLRSYQTRYYASAVRNILKRHRLLLDRDFPRYETRFRVTATQQQRWFDLFDVSDRERGTPFTYHATSGTLLLMRIVQDIGVNFRYLMHLKNETALHPGGRRLESDVDYHLGVALSDVVALRDDRVALVVEARVRAPDDELLQLNRDVFVILHVAPEAMESLRKSSQFGRYPTDGLLKRSGRRSKAERDQVRSVSIHVPGDMGTRYGKVSGDLNPVHTTKAAAKLFGHPRPFVQGLCTANYVLRVLTGSFAEPLQRLDIQFARPVFVDQQVEIRFDDHAFEVTDDRGKMLAFGEHAYSSGDRGHWDSETR